MVHLDGGAAAEAEGRRREGDVDPAGDRQANGQLARQHGRLEHQPQALLGPPAPLLHVREWALLRDRERGGASGTRRARARSSPRAPSPVDRRGRRGVPGVQGREQARSRGGGLLAGRGDRAVLDARLAARQGVLEKWFPADYIVEMVEQVRLWFYSELFFSVVLTGESPYRACQTFMPMLAAPGEEFHKTGGNMVSLVEACELVGADAIRWVVAKADLQEIMYFGWPPFEELKRKILVLWNTYKFFVSYANLDGFDPSERAVPVTERPLLDRWLLSSLARLVADCRRAYEAYDVRSAILKIEAFWDELSTWYVRRNRRRVWKARSHGYALAAY